MCNIVFPYYIMGFTKKRKSGKKRRGGTKKNDEPAAATAAATIYKYINKDAITDQYFNTLIQPLFDAKTYDLFLLKFHMDFIGLSLSIEDYLVISYHKRYTEDIEDMYKTLNTVFIPHLIKCFKGTVDVVEKCRNFIGDFCFSKMASVNTLLETLAKSTNHFLFQDKSKTRDCFLYNSWMLKLGEEIGEFGDEYGGAVDAFIETLNLENETSMDEDEATLIDLFNPYTYLLSSIFMPTLSNWRLIVLSPKLDYSTVSFGAFHRNQNTFKKFAYQFIVAFLGIAEVADATQILGRVSRSIYVKFKIPSKVLMVINSHGSIPVKKNSAIKMTIPDEMEITKINSVPASLCDLSDHKKKTNITGEMTDYLKRINYDMEQFNMCDLVSTLKQLHLAYHAQKVINPEMVHHSEKICEAIKNDESFSQFNMSSGETIIDKIYGVDEKLPFYEILIMNSVNGNVVNEQINLYDLFNKSRMFFSEIVHFLKENGVTELYVFDFSCNEYNGDIEDYEEIHRHVKKYKFGGRKRT